MVKGKYISALDIGTSKVIALIGEVQEDNEIHIVNMDKILTAAGNHRQFLVYFQNNNLGFFRYRFRRRIGQ